MGNSKSGQGSDAALSPVKLCWPKAPKSSSRVLKLHSIKCLVFNLSINCNDLCAHLLDLLTLNSCNKIAVICAPYNQTWPLFSSFKPSGFEQQLAGNALGHSGASAVVPSPLFGRDRKESHTHQALLLWGAAEAQQKETSLLLTTALSSAWLWSVICRNLSNIHLWLFGKKPSCTGQIRVPNVCVCIPLGIPVMGIPDGLQRREGLVCHLFSQVTMKRLKGKKL